MTTMKVDIPDKITHTYNIHDGQCSRHKYNLNSSVRNTKSPHPNLIKAKSSIIKSTPQVSSTSDQAIYKHTVTDSIQCVLRINVYFLIRYLYTPNIQSQRVQRPPKLNIMPRCFVYLPTNSQHTLQLRYTSSLFTPHHTINISLTFNEIHAMRVICTTRSPLQSIDWPQTKRENYPMIDKTRNRKRSKFNKSRRGLPKTIPSNHKTKRAKGKQK